MMKTQLLCMALCTALGTQADDHLLIAPQEITAGATASARKTFSIEMSNEQPIVGLQFDMYLPEGVRIANKSSFKMSRSRFPNYYDDFDEAYVYDHSITLSWHEAEGFYRVIVVDMEDNSPIKGNSGKLFDVLYTSAADMPTGILPVRLANVVLTLNGSEDIKPVVNRSFVYTSDVDWGTQTSIDLTGLDGITTADVVAAARTTMSNPNALLYVNEGSDDAGLDNVVVGDVCAKLSLTDKQPFCATSSFTATSATYSRNVTAEGWYSLCLPFAAATPDGVQTERFQSVDNTANTITFDTGEVEADVPCIFHAPAGTVTFSGSNASIAATPDDMADGALHGTYRQLPAGTITGSYALHADGTGFGMATSTAYCPPFRAIVQADSQAPRLALVHHGTTDGIDAAAATPACLNGKRIYGIDGKVVPTTHAHGIYIIGKQKIAR